MSDGQDERQDRLLKVLEAMAGGELDRRLPISPEHDVLDAVAHGVNVLVGELQFATGKLQRAKDEADAANHAKTLFLRNVSHEIRTPLSAILSITRLALATGDAARRDEFLRRILSNGTALLGLVDDLLDLSKLEADRLPIESQSFAVMDVVDAVVSDLAPQAEAKGLQLIVEWTPTQHVSVLADFRRVRQILTNVIGNAIKFTATGMIRVRSELLEESDEIAVDVTDSGIGLTASQIPMLFDPFTQADESISRRFGGSGLGLALSRRLARAMRGELQVQGSTPGRGTTFRLTLPTGVEAPTPVSVQPLRSPGANLSGARILLAEDYDDIRLAMVALLQIEGANVVDVGDGLSAVDRAMRDPFDVLLFDVRMPQLDGLEATRRLRANGIRTPIVALTADAVREHRDECMAAGCDAYLSKPVDMAQLLEVTHRLWRR